MSKPETFPPIQGNCYLGIDAGSHHHESMPWSAKTAPFYILFTATTTEVLLKTAIRSIQEIYKLLPATGQRSYIPAPPDTAKL